ncbi:MAG: hypothetical protein ACNA7W_07190 [Pseudomonadales bacterium]
MAPPLTKKRIHRENLAFAGTGGVSAVNRCSRFEPAFRDEATGRVEVARFSDGRRAPMHLIDGLPAEWVEARDEHGRACALKPDIIAGFVRDGAFYTRDEAADLAE